MKFLEIFSSFLVKHRRLVSIVILVFSAVFGYYYTRIPDNNSLYTQFRLHDPEENYYLREYVDDFGKDDQILISFALDDVLEENSFKVVSDVHRLLENLTLSFDARTGKVFLPEVAGRPLAERVRFLLRPVKVDVEWSGNSGWVKPSRWEIMKGQGEKRTLHVERQNDIGTLKPIRFVDHLPIEWVNFKG